MSWESYSNQVCPSAGTGSCSSLYAYMDSQPQINSEATRDRADKEIKNQFRINPHVIVQVIPFT